MERLGDSYVFRAYPSATVAGSETAHKAEHKIMETLGEEHFFDKDEVDTSALKTDDGTAARVERKIEEIKAPRSNAILAMRSRARHSVS